ncbi:MAG: histidine kinase, partial [Calditrichae bacterium]|nr:histidine kinase [Calditrichia bacterium]
NYQFRLDLDENLPQVSINEFVVWEVLEPLIQNCVEHCCDDDIIVFIQTQYVEEKKISRIIIGDNGVGFKPSLLEKNTQGIKKLFMENISTKERNKNSGYGCYI